MARCCSWFKRYCCCCCCCDDDNDAVTTTVHTPLLAKKEPPVKTEDGFSELQVKEEGAGETQLMEVMVADETKESPQLPVKATATETVPASEELVTPPPESEPSTFVRGTGSRSSWRVVPTITSQARDAAKTVVAHNNKPSEDPTATSTNQTVAREVQTDQSKHEDRNIVLLPQELDDDESLSLEETNVTVTFSFNESKLSHQQEPQQQSKENQELD